MPMPELVRVREVGKERHKILDHLQDGPPIPDHPLATLMRQVYLKMIVVPDESRPIPIPAAHASPPVRVCTPRRRDFMP